MNNEQEQPAVEEEVGAPHEQVSLDHVEVSDAESQIIDAYTDLQPLMRNLGDMTEKEYAESKVALDNFFALLKSDHLAPDFKADMLAQGERLKADFDYSKKLKDALRLLEKESAGGMLHPEWYRRIIDLFQRASAAGVSISILDEARPHFEKYLQQIHRDAGIK